MATEAPRKPIHALILDTGPLIKNVVSISTIINSAEEIFTTSAILSEIRDEITRSRVQTQLMPFLKVRNPSPASYEAVITFSKKTGDHAVLSRQDLGILALAYEVHCERNGGSWGLREAPKQPIKRRPGEEAKMDEKMKQRRGKKEETKVTGSENREQPTGEQKEAEQQGEDSMTSEFDQPSGREFGLEQPEERIPAQSIAMDQPKTTESHVAPELNVPEQLLVGQNLARKDDEKTVIGEIQQFSQATVSQPQTGDKDIVQEALQEEQRAMDTKLVQSTAQETSAVDVEQFQFNSSQQPKELKATEVEQDITESTANPAAPTQDLSTVTIPTSPSPQATDDSDSDGDWITPSNISSHQAKDSGLQTNSHTSNQVQMDIATMTIDFAMQAVLLQMNLKLLSTNMQRIKQLTSKVLRCHACFNIVKDMDKQFCPRCGGANLRRVSCSTNSKGEFRIHLSKNYQFNKRGDRYSVPKPIAGTANGKWSGQGGGQGGWGRDLILAEDQKEYQKQVEQDRRKKGARDLMDDDYLPGILTGDRGGRAGGRPKVGAGKNANSKKRY